MIAEIVCIGTELLLGDIVNTNASFLGKELSTIGINLFYITTVGDNKDRIKKALEIAYSRADLIITSGGLGPTEDDLTHESISEFLNVDLEFKPELKERLVNIFKTRGRELSISNLKQTYIPKGSQILENKYGTAAGMIYNKDKKIILTFPGVPKELYDMWENVAKPYLYNLVPEKKLLKSRVLRFIGQSESKIAEDVSDLLSLENPTVAPLVGKGEVTLRITARASNEIEAESLIEPVEQEIIKRLSEYYYGKDNDSLPFVLQELFSKSNKTLAVAESFTGGLIAERIVSVSGASDYFKLGLVCYSNDMKIKLLGINEETINSNTVYSSQVAIEMAQKVRDIAGTDWGIGTTGLAGTTDRDNVKAGSIFVAVASKDSVTVKYMNYNGWKREDIIFMGSQISLNLLRQEFLKDK